MKRVGAGKFLTFNMGNRIPQRSRDRLLHGKALIEHAQGRRDAFIGFVHTDAAHCLPLAAAPVGAGDYIRLRGFGWTNPGARALSARPLEMQGRAGSRRSKA